MPRSTIITMLNADHRKVVKLFRELKMTTTRGPARRQGIFAEIDEMLSVHADFEEREVYPLIPQGKNAESIGLEAVEEHLQVKRLIVELRELEPQDERWMAKAQVLMEDVRHHIEEEESDVFPEVRKGADLETLRRLAVEYQACVDGTQRKTGGGPPDDRSGSPNTHLRSTDPMKSRAMTGRAKRIATGPDAAGKLKHDAG